MTDTTTQTPSSAEKSVLMLRRSEDGRLAVAGTPPHTVISSVGWLVERMMDGHVDGKFVVFDTRGSDAKVRYFIDRIERAGDDPNKGAVHLRLVTED